jgi:DNA-binding transcriptional regulator PaaX
MIGITQQKIIKLLSKSAKPMSFGLIWQLSGYSQDSVRASLRRLVKRGYVVVDKSQKAYQYSLPKSAIQKATGESK